MPANARRTGRLLFLVYCTFLMGRHPPTGHAVYIVVGGWYAWQCAKIQRCPETSARVDCTGGRLEQHAGGWEWSIR